MRTTPVPLLSALALAAACQGAAAAEWTLLPLPASSGVAVYADPATEQPRHNKFVGFFAHNPIQAWFVTDYAVPHRWGLHEVLSSKQLVELDCKRGSTRMLVRYYYEGPMAQGRLLVSDAPAKDFTRVVPGEPEEAMLQSTCARARARALDEPQHETLAPQPQPQPQPQ